MFTGIVEELGTVASLKQLADSARLTIEGPLVTAGTGPGSSIAVSGVCLTVTETSDGEFTADVMGETLARTSLGTLREGGMVNLERPVPATGRLDGHIVQGHVDGTGVIIERRSAEGWTVVAISIPSWLARYVAEKGSVAVDGVSLTVSALGDGAGPGGRPPEAPRAAIPRAGAEDWFEVSLIPETLARTTLGTAAVGDTVNIEVDVIAKYVERLLASQLSGGEAR